MIINDIDDYSNMAKICQDEGTKTPQGPKVLELTARKLQLGPQAQKHQPSRPGFRCQVMPSPKDRIL